MKATGIAWDAFDVTLKHVLHNAYNVLVGYLNENGLNNDNNADYWLCTAIDGLIREDPMTYWEPLKAMQTYITDVYCLTRFIYKHTGHEWSDFDFERDLYLCWRDAFFDRMDAYGLAVTELVFFSQPIVQPIVPDWEMDGVLRYHRREERK